MSIKNTTNMQRYLIIPTVSKKKKKTHQNVCPHFVMCAADIISKQIGLKENGICIHQSFDNCW